MYDPIVDLGLEGQHNIMAFLAHFIKQSIFGLERGVEFGVHSKINLGLALGFHSKRYSGLECGLHFKCPGVGNALCVSNKLPKFD